jgi:IS5 family transposase
MDGVHASEVGNFAYPPLMKFKALLIQTWHQLSDPQLESQLARDLLFCRFVGMGISDAVPHHTVFVRFRAPLCQHGLFEVLFNEINQQLTEQSIIKLGQISIIDATVTEAHRARPRKGSDGNNTQDPEAGHNVKTAANGKQTHTYGFKNHLNVEKDGFITHFAVTAGNVHDSQVFEQIIPSDTACVYADSAYVSRMHDMWLKACGIDNRMIRRAYRNKPLTQAEKEQNRLNASVRSTIERVFGVLKLHLGMAKTKYLGLARNHAYLCMVAMAYNLKRAAKVNALCLG